MKELYNGKLSWENVPQAIEEVKTIRNELSKYNPEQVVWDIDDLSKQPPWGQNISDHITSLSNYFITSDGRDVFEVLLLVGGAGPPGDDRGICPLEGGVGK